MPQQPLKLLILLPLLLLLPLLPQPLLVWLLPIVVRVLNGGRITSANTKCAACAGHAGRRGRTLHQFTVAAPSAHLA
jgi:hypothetical protein